MTRMIMAVCGERYDAENGSCGGWHVRRYAYLDELQEGARQKDEDYVLAMVNRLGASFDNGVETSWRVGEKPPANLDRFFDIYLEVNNHLKPDASYRVDYHRYNGCPSGAVSDGMEIYRAIKKYGINPTNKNLKRQRRLDEEAAEAEKKRVKFVPGVTYWAENADQFGHLIRSHITFDSNMSKKVRRYDNGNEYLNFKRSIYKAENAELKNG